MQDGFERFRELAAAYGARRSQWPAQAQAIYDRFADTPEAQLVLAGAQQIDQFLSLWQPDVREHDVAARILYTLPPQGQPSRYATPLRYWPLPAAVFMAIALLGFGHGYFSADNSEFAVRDMPAAFGMADVEEE